MKVELGRYEARAAAAYDDELRRAAESALAMGGPPGAALLGVPVIVECAGSDTLDGGHEERWVRWRFQFESFGRSWCPEDLGELLETAGYSRV